MNTENSDHGYKGGVGPRFFAKPRGITYRFFFGIVLFVAGCLHPAQGENFGYSGGFSNPILSGSDYSTTYDPGAPGANIPAVFNLYRDSGDSQVFTLTVNLNGPVDHENPSFSESMFAISGDSGAVTVNVNGTMTYRGPTQDNFSTGNAGVQVLGLWNADSLGVDITINHSGSLTVNGSGFNPSGATPYAPNPSGFRTAQLSGLEAVSLGYQATDTTAWAGGNVEVETFAGSSITMTQSDAEVITASISASSAAGPGTNFGAHPELNNVTVSHSAAIDVSAGSGIGIFATATGAQTSGSSAVGGEVKVHLYDSAGGTFIRVNDHDGDTGQTGIGVFAVSEAYALNEGSKGANVAGGHVEVDLDQNTSISVGNSNSLLSIGVLAISTGTDAFINPFSSQTVSKAGSGFGGGVDVTNDGSVTTWGKVSVGIAALSLGGAGQVTSVSGSGDSYVGSSGSTDGGGATVNVTNDATGEILTLGEGAHGILAISSASGGLVNNDLAAAASSSPNPSDPEAGATGLVLGNNTSGGSAHSGGVVTINNYGQITTGDGTVSSKVSMGILAMSIGGGGGNAGGDHAALFVGDKGGAGGAGGAVAVNTYFSSTLKTYDENSIGILAQSIGGGGGNGANAKGLFVAVGGRGGTGGAGGTVTVDHFGELDTNAHYSAGIVGQSVGGGGGNGGTATAFGTVISTGVGGKGGTGGAGGQVTGTVEALARVTTRGNNSAGMHLQSVGGGGGTGGAALSDAGGILSINIAVGGHGGTGGAGGTIIARNNGTITTGIEVTPSVGGAPIVDGNDSYGVLAQSVGGGGGHAGSSAAHSLDLGGEEIPAIGFDMALGGTGGTAGSGGQISLINDGSVTTWGDGSHAILAQTVGGGGGTGGDSTAMAALLTAGAPEVSVTVAHGGNGGGAGAGGDISVTALSGGSTITTHGQGAAGIVAQSIGGGGGNGGVGNASTKTPNISGATNFVTNIGLGGAGGGGGNAGFINITNEGSIETSGSGSQGILAQAIGGGGGHASGGSASGGNNSYEFDLSIGGTGGSGGSASNSSTNDDYSIKVANHGNITTSAGDASGIMAQSIGGGGGNGGTSDVEAGTGVLANIADSFMPSSTYAATISVGGTGGTGGAGGAVSIDNTAGSTVSTLGTRSHGMFAQSISGGGGTGGSADSTSNSALVTPFTFEDPPEPDPEHPEDPVDPPARNQNFSVNASVGGGGGNTHAGGAVTLDNEGAITTAGYSSHAVFAQSIGGGGGVAADGSMDTRTTLNLGVRTSGAEGESGSGGAINIGNTGSISTSHNDAYGVFAQSVGGGGGLATQGTDIPFVISPSFGVYPNLHAGITLGIDLKNNDAIDGGTVAITNGGTGPDGGSIHTEGDWSMGIVAQSVGGGGGKAGTVFGTNTNALPDLDVQLGAHKGYGNGNTVQVTLNSSTDIQTGNGGDGRGFAAYGIVAQSIGGGGGLATDGSSAATGSLNLGGETKDATGNGNTVTLQGIGAVGTQGEAAHGIILQSVGGGGGIAGSGSSRDYQASLDGVIAPSITLGGQNSYGHGGTVNLTNANLTVSTGGDNAFGIILQSVGGGGGIATTKQTGDQAASSITLGRTATDSDQEDGGEINATLAAGSSVTTTGDGSHAIVVQSIGGGGGIANPVASVGTVVPTQEDYLENQAHGYGGETHLTVDAIITTSGVGANGILAQVIGGGGGLQGNMAGSTGGSNSSTDGSKNGSLTITQSGSIAATGVNSVGIFAQNVTGNGNAGNDIGITVNGSVQGSYAGLWMDGGNSNHLQVNAGGSVTGVGGVGAIYYTTGQHLNVTNAGTVTGSIDLNGSSTGTFTNNSGGVYTTGSLLIGNVTDNGTTSIGGDDNAEATEMSSVFTQGSNALLKLEIWSIEGYDHLDFTGSGHGDFKGSLQITVHNSGFNLQVGEVITLIGGADNNVFDFVGVGFLGLGNGVILTPFIGSDKSYNLEVMAVPEPTTWALLVLGLLIPILLRCISSCGTGSSIVGVAAKRRQKC